MLRRSPRTPKPIHGSEVIKNWLQDSAETYRSRFGPVRRLFEFLNMRVLLDETAMAKFYEIDSILESSPPSANPSIKAPFDAYSVDGNIRYLSYTIIKAWCVVYTRYTPKNINLTQPLYDLLLHIESDLRPILQAEHVALMQKAHDRNENWQKIRTEVMEKRRLLREEKKPQDVEWRRINDEAEADYTKIFDPSPPTTVSPDTKSHIDSSAIEEVKNALDSYIRESDQRIIALRAAIEKMIGKVL